MNFSPSPFLISGILVSSAGLLSESSFLVFRWEGIEFIPWSSWFSNYKPWSENKFWTLVPSTCPAGPLSSLPKPWPYMRIRDVHTTCVSSYHSLSRATNVPKEEREHDLKKAFCVFLECVLPILFLLPGIHYPQTFFLSLNNYSLNFKTKSIYHFFKEVCSTSPG